VLPCDLERATSVRVRKTLLELSANGGSSTSSTACGAGGGGLAALELMMGKPVLHHLVKHGIADKMAGKEQWTDEDKTWRAEDLPYVEYIES
jgi:nicotinamide mononucleotide adenylyltransferase